MEKYESDMSTVEYRDDSSGKSFNLDPVELQGSEETGLLPTGWVALGDGILGRVWTFMGHVSNMFIWITWSKCILNFLKKHHSNILQHTRTYSNMFCVLEACSGIWSWHAHMTRQERMSAPFPEGPGLLSKNQHDVELCWRVPVSTS